MPPRRWRLPGSRTRRGWAIVSLPIETVDKAALTLLGLGPEVTVVEPMELRAALRDLAHQVMGMAAL